MFKRVSNPLIAILMVGHYIGCFLWAALHSVVLGYVVTGILHSGLCLDASNDPDYRYKFTLQKHTQRSRPRNRKERNSEYFRDVQSTKLKQLLLRGNSA